MFLGNSAGAAIKGVLQLKKNFKPYPRKHGDEVEEFTLGIEISFYETQEDACRGTIS